MPPAPPLLGRPAGRDLLLIVVALLGVSASAPLIVAIAAPALAIALWRNVIGGAVLLVVSAVREGPGALRLDRRTPEERRAVLLAAVYLAVHFATWVPSVTLTSVASATALVATQPVWNALLARRRGEVITSRAWAGIAVSLLGVLVLTGVDVTSSPRALLGDVLALAGAVAAAFYVEHGAIARRTLSTTTYAGLCYALAAGMLLVVCLVGRVPLVGFAAGAWVGIVALTVLAQLVGHTLINRVLATVSPVVVGLLILAEPPLATVLAALWLGQVPSLAVIPSALLVIAGVALVVSSGRRAEEVDPLP